MKKIATIALFVCGAAACGATVPADSADGGGDASSLDASPSNQDAGSVDAPNDNNTVVPKTCTELTGRALTSVDDAKAALRASPAFPFPGGWEVCDGPNTICPDTAAPALSFNATWTEASCGQNSEGGYRAATKFAMSVREVSPPPSGGGGKYALDLTLEAGVATYEVKALRDDRFFGGLALIDATSSVTTTYKPLQSLP